VEEKTVVGRASGFGYLEHMSELGDNSSDNSTYDLVNEAISERRRDHVEEEGGSEGGLHLARKTEHFVYLTTKKKSSEFV
jgi:hypothetical protein